jgi:phage-related protein
MAGSTFIWVPSYGAQETSKPTVRGMQFGDGYEQRISYGLNTDLKSWSVSFDNVTTAVKDQITGFLDARGGSQNFNWLTPNGAVGSFICQDWNSSAVAPDTWSITATFREVVDL